MAPRKRRREPDAIETANKKTDDEFLRDHIQHPGEGFEAWVTSWRHPSSNVEYTLSLTRSEFMSDADLTSCLDMIDLTSGEDYRNSVGGWSREAKTAEMKSPDLRYILVKDGAGVIAAFTSLMPTYEDGQPVVYCYEIHLLDQVRKSGLGKLLMGYLCNVAASIPPIDKVMLTCFVANEGARAFYSKMGFVKDDISPEPRRLRNGVTREPDYMVLSCAVGQRLRGKKRVLAPGSRTIPDDQRLH